MKINQSDIVKSLAADQDMPQAKVKTLLEGYGEIVKGELAEGNAVILLGLGTLKTVETAAREGRNPATGEAVQIPAGRKVKFKAGKELKGLIRG